MTVTEQAFVHPSEQAEARGTHYIEEGVRVYLMRDLSGTDTWSSTRHPSVSRCARITRIWRTATAFAASLTNVKRSRVVWRWPISRTVKS